LQAPNPDQKRKKCEEEGEEGEEGARLISVFPCENQNTIIFPTRKIPIPQRKRLAMRRWKQKKTTMTIR
jgi:hypothetical protein